MGFAKIPTALGFPIRHRLIIGVPEGHLWGLVVNGEIEPCSEEGIEGLLYGFQIKQVEPGQKGKTRLKIFIKDLQTDDVDMIATGFEANSGDITWFARSFCLNLCDPEFNHSKPLILTPHKGKKHTDSKVVFCRIFQGGKLLVNEQKGVDCLGVLTALSSNFPDVPLYPSENEIVEETSKPIDQYQESQPSEETVSFDDLMARNNACLKRLGWSQEQGREYLDRTYGKRSRQTLSDEQFIEFTKYLESLVDLLNDPDEF